MDEGDGIAAAAEMGNGKWQEGAKKVGTIDRCKVGRCKLAGRAGSWETES